MILGMIFLIAAIVSFIAIFCTDKKTVMATFSAFTCLLFFIGLLLILKAETRPTPLDVYRGRTTLQITYQDSVAIDSVVVYK